MGESAVRFGHFVRVFTLLHRIAAIICGIEDFTREPPRHRRLVAAASSRNDPTDRQGARTVGANFDRHLIGGAANTPRTHFQRRADIS